jgi:hypothetical protein
VVAGIVRDLTKSKMSWVDREGKCQA